MSASVRQQLRVLLSPLSQTWAFAMGLRRKFYPQALRYRSCLKVICVGNIHSGGSGKTPMVRALAEGLKEKKPVILSRGYRGALSAVGSKVDLDSSEGPQLYGDEPWMLAHQIQAPVYISKNRAAAMRKIEKAHPSSLVILDDGFQHLALDRDLNIVCINAGRKWEESACYPVGDLREPMSALGSCHAIVLTPGALESEATKWLAELKRLFPEKPVFLPQICFEGFFEGLKQVPLDPKTTWVSFCGIARPERFLNSLKGFTPLIRHLRSFPDHHHYSRSDVRALIDSGGAEAGFVTTEKDWYKIEKTFSQLGKRLLSLRYRYELPNAFWDWMAQQMG